ncbi:MAG: triose-phosphate isomerase [Flavobacteriales bacterium]|nr:triose-phosphate isomerase [Flavobacteriales bacterium]
MRKQIVVANWKMNNSPTQSSQLCSLILSKMRPTDKEVIIAPSYLYLNSVVATTQNSIIKVAAQNCHQEISGAYTGEVSASMLADLGLDYVILGHSERRYYYGEDNSLLAKKVSSALSQGLKVIYCCGETLDQRISGAHLDRITKQLTEGLFHLPAKAMKNIVIGYEPIWAVGTGITATSAQAQEMHAHIRSALSDKYGADVAHDTSILYGGSCTPSNAKELFAQKDVDGGLIGGASLNADDFLAIVNA